MPNDRVLVYSTDGSLPLPKPEHARKPGPKPSSSAPPDDGIVRVGCEHRRGGKMTLIHGLNPKEIDATAKALKRRCGTGGTVKEGVVELQGDHRDTVLAYLAEHKSTAKRMGGG